MYLQVMDPAAFGGAANFVQQTSFHRRSLPQHPPAPGVDAVRLPGEQGLACKRQALAAGLSLYPDLMTALEPWAEKLGVALPAPAR